MTTLVASKPQQKARPEHLHGLRILAERGYGSRHHILNLIAEGKVPAVKVGKSYKIRDSDLHLLAEPVVPASLDA